MMTLTATAATGADPGRFLELLERLRETFGLYEEAAALAEQQVRDAIAAAERIRREAAAGAIRLQPSDAAVGLQAELDALRIERDQLQAERDQLAADRETQERRFGEEIAELRGQVEGMAGAIAGLMQQLGPAVVAGASRG